jgi:hypothetical protein
MYIFIYSKNGRAGVLRYLPIHNASLSSVATHTGGLCWPGMAKNGWERKRIQIMGEKIFQCNNRLVAAMEKVLLLYYFEVLASN